jgi:hypothetical protein
MDDKEMRPRGLFGGSGPLTSRADGILPQCSSRLTPRAFCHICKLRNDKANSK